MATQPTWFAIGDRIRETRLIRGLTQAALADRVEMDRTSLVKIENGDRKVSALELFAIADALRVPMPHLVSTSPQAIVSRRAVLTEDEAGPAARLRYETDIELETHLRDTALLVGDGLLAPPPLPELPPPADENGARRLAQEARAMLDVPVGPLGPMADAAEVFGLYLVSIDADSDGASIIDSGYGVGVVGGRAPAGRRRWTAAHELGHHLLRDEYHSEAGVAASRDERERLIDAFAGEFLLPVDEVLPRWSAADPRGSAIRIAGQYRVSWTAVLRAAMSAGALTKAELAGLRSPSPIKGDFIRVLGHEPPEDLAVGTLGAEWKKAVLLGVMESSFTPTRAVELLRRTVDEDQIPVPPIDDTP